MAISVAIEVKPEVEKWWQTKKNQLFDPGFLFAPNTFGGLSPSLPHGLNVGRSGLVLGTTSPVLSLPNIPRHRGNIVFADYTERNVAMVTIQWS